ncbi:hypothetical protein BU15DRAFT_81843 [Melanogaster broomeanus]|nr:hypothetical protein BU15DRAFT_81843 [Melanogaster broomeanus]
MSPPDDRHGISPRPTRGVLRVKSFNNLGKTAPSAVPPARSSTRPSSRASRELLFAEVTPDDVHVYESAPSLRNEQSTYTLISPRRMAPSQKSTPEYIRRRPFPDIAAQDPSLAWIESSSSETDHSAPRFDLNDDIFLFLLSRSTVAAQRVSIFSILAKIACRLGQQVRQPNLPDKITEFSGEEGELRKRVLAAGLVAIDQIGSLGARAVEGRMRMSRRLDYFLPQVTGVLSHAALPSESLAQLLAILYRLAQEPNELAEAISPLPNPFAIQLLITLASPSPADAFLRFVTLLPPLSPSSPSSLHPSLQTPSAFTPPSPPKDSTATSQPRPHSTSPLSEHTSSPLKRMLRVAWASLVEAWILSVWDGGWKRASLGKDLGWLEGSRVNGVRGGWKDDAGLRFAIVSSSLEAIEEEVQSSLRR